MELLNSFKRYLMRSVPDMVVKNSRTAESYETLETRFNGDVYVSAVLETDSFVTYNNFHESSLRRAGFTDENQIKLMLEDKYNIPATKHDEVVLYEREYVIEHFVEMNEYYRILNGLPPLNYTEDQYIYPPIDILDIYGVSNKAGTPIHLLSKATLESMDKAGYLDSLQETHPNEMYISHLGLRKISIESARMTDHYGLLYFPRFTDAERFYEDFIMYYDEAKEYILTNIYNYTMAGQYEQYDGCMGFIMLTIAIDSMINNLFKVMIERDFYDLATVHMFFDAYNVPFINIFTLQQQKMIVKNLNILLMKKHTSEVLYNVLDLLGYNNIELSKYILVKQHKMERDNIEADLHPVFVYKVMVDDFGNTYLALDKSSMYDLYFIRMNMDDPNVQLVGDTDAMAYRYEDITVPDATWIEDDELESALNDTEFNYQETKYSSVAITFKMHEIMLETAYIGRMLLDKRCETANVKIELASICSTPASLYDIQLLLICLTCKRNRMTPNILYSPSQILYILGFNFEEDLELIKEDIKNHPRDYGTYGTTISKYLENITFNSTDDVNDMFNNVRALEEFLSNAIQTTNDYSTYVVYKKLYNTLFAEKLNSDLYKLEDGTNPETFAEALEYSNHSLYEYYVNLNTDDCSDAINYITTKLTTVLVDTKFLNYLNQIDETLIDGIIRILKFFKTYTIDIKGVDVIYQFDSREENLIRLLTKFEASHAKIYPMEHWYDLLQSQIMGMSETVYHQEDDNTLKDGMLYGSTHLLPRVDYIHLISELYLDTILKIIDPDKLFYGDSVALSNKNCMKDRLVMDDTRGLQFIWEE